MSKIRTANFRVQRHARVAVRGPDDPSVVREVWIVLHGYAQLAVDFAVAFEPIDDGTRLIIAPEALSRFYDPRTEAGQHAQALVGASWMTRESRESEILDYLGWLDQCWAHFAPRLPTGIPLTVLGFSQGATTASRWVASGKVPAKRLICWGASLAPELPLGEGAVLRGVETHVVIGSRDKFVSAEQVEEERVRLEAAGFPVIFHGFVGGHRLDDPTLRRLAGMAEPSA